MRPQRLTLLALTALCACASRPAHAPREVFDERTASTMLVAAEPLVFARDRFDLAAYAHDYATLVAIDVDRSGSGSDYLLLYRWSTVDRRMLPPAGADAGTLRILADGRRIDLAPLERLPVDLTHRRLLHVPNHGDVRPYAYRVDGALLRFLAQSREITLRMPHEPLDAPFALSGDGREALTRFLSHAGTN